MVPSVALFIEVVDHTLIPSECALVRQRRTASSYQQRPPPIKLLHIHRPMRAPGGVGVHAPLVRSSKGAEVEADVVSQPLDSKIFQ